MKRISAFIARVFRERELILRSETGVRYLVLTPLMQQAMAAGALLAIVALIWTVIAREQAWRLVDVNRQEVARVEDAYRAAIGRIGTAVDTAQEKGRAEGAAAMHDLVQQNEALQRQLKDLGDRLADAESERTRAAAAHEALVARMRRLDDQLHAVAAHHQELSSLMSTLSDGLGDAMAERGRLAVDAEIAGLGQKPNGSDPDHSAAIDRLTQRTQAGIDSLKRVIQRTGLNSDKLLAGSDQGGMGGPFVPVPAGADTTHARLVSLGAQIGRLAVMRKLIHSLPIGAPLAEYELRSSFGVRRDPITGQLAMHEGLDLAGPYHEPVMATAAGTVKVAGWSGEYGNMVEIDHGYGLMTRYAHLSRIRVKVGQKVTARQAIGLLGSTGRSTGPHVHYEVLSDGKAVNPAKFLEAARYVPK